MRHGMFAGRLPAPMLPTLADRAFNSDDWLFELKWDGVRAVCLVERDRILAVSRTGRDLSAQFPELHALTRSFRGLPVVVDGEIVSLDSKGRSSFQRLQSRINRIRGRDEPTPEPVTFAVFDLLGQRGEDLRERPLAVRKSMLERSIRDGGCAMFSKHVVGGGKRLFEQASRKQVEGIVAKREDSPYRSGRTREWLKIKAVRQQEFVIGGWTEPQGSRHHLGALLVGLYEGRDLVYAGHVGTGFNAATLTDLNRRLSPLATDRPPFRERPKTNTPAHWTRPKLVAEIKFAEWTRDGILRAPVFLGLRIDKRPEECVRETPRVHVRTKR